jgi:hypothetical protein
VKVKESKDVGQKSFKGESKMKEMLLEAGI